MQQLAFGAYAVGGAAVVTGAVLALPQPAAALPHQPG